MIDERELAAPVERPQRVGLVSALMLDQAEAVDDDRRRRLAPPACDLEGRLDVDAGPLMIPEAAVRVGDEGVEASLELVVAELAGYLQRPLGRCDRLRGLPRGPA